MHETSLQGSDARRRRGDLDLHLTVVEYSDRPDRCTVYPPGLTSVERMATWLSADRSAFVSLQSMR